MTRVCVNQPYFFPYAGYFGLIEKCDLFVVYDDVKFTKGGWINRNRILSHGSVLNFSLPLQKASDYLNISERKLSATYDPDKLFRSLEGAYRNTTNWVAVRDSLAALLKTDAPNLFDFLFETLKELCGLLGIKTEFVRASEANSNDDEVSGLERLLAILQSVGTTEYINLPGGKSLYNREDFEEQGIRLGFSQFTSISYPQEGSRVQGESKKFVDNLSVIDIISNLGFDATRDYILATNRISWA